MTENSSGDGQAVRNLPSSFGRSFATLGEYLAHEREAGPVDRPWYRRIGPGVYERVSTERVPGARHQPQTFTR